MLARCTHCQHTFVIQQFGRQRCPQCGTEVSIADPRAGAYMPPATMVDPVQEPYDSVGQLTPWERRDELGLFRALGQTITGTMGTPGPFFTGIRYDVEKGGLLYYLLIGLVPLIISQFTSWLMTDPATIEQSLEQVKPLLRDLDPNTRRVADYFLQQAMTSHTASGLALSLIQVVIYAVVFLVLFAGVPHLILMLLGRAPGGWTASFKASIYSLTPMFITVIPVCGGIIGITWATALQIYALSKAHRITVGMASVGVLGLHALAITCCCGVAGLSTMAIMSAVRP